MANSDVGNSVKVRRLIALLCLAVLLALGVAASSSASFSGPSGKIFFQGGGDIFAINPDGSEEVDLTPGETLSEERPSGSADGRHVVFQSYRNGGFNVISMNADGSNQTDLTNTEEPVLNFEPAFSPDGSKVAFMRQGLTAGEQDIWVMNANGSGQVDLTESLPLLSTAPEFSPDGTKIAFIGAGPTPCCSTEYNNDIWVMNANGSGATQLTHTNNPTQNISPAWSPDGAEIAYSTNESTGGTDNGIHVMDANGANPHRLLPGGNPVLTNNISWSPDGTKIVYEGSGGDHLSIINADGTGATPLVPSSTAKYPSWVPLASGGGTIEPPPAVGGGAPGTGLPVPTPVKPKPKALTCKKGFKKKVVKGKLKCVKKHKSHKGKPKP